MTDTYTERTKAWLEERFSQTQGGIYFAHQPVYGFGRGNSETGCLVEMYVRSWQILKTLAGLEFETLLDAGAAEGYKAFLVRELLGKRVESCDLAEAACLRARELFGIPARQADLHALPYADDSFDVVLCSESLEHVTDWRRCLDELLRVARRAVLITVPHEDPELTEAHREQEDMHAHIHAFDLQTFDAWARDYAVSSRPLVSTRLKWPRLLLEAQPREGGGRAPAWAVTAYNRLVPAIRPLSTVWTIARLLELDERLCARYPQDYAAVLTLIEKPASRRIAPRPLRPEQMLAMRAPYLVL